MDARHVAVLAGAAAAALVCALPISARPAGATTVIGSSSLAANEGTADFLGQNVPVFQGDAAGGYVTSSPANGTIVSWSFRSAGVRTGDRFVLRVLDPDATGTVWRVVATSSPATVTSATGTDAKLGPFTADIPIEQGERIALQPLDEGYTPIEQGVAGKDGIRYFASPLGEGSSESLAPGSGADNGQVVPIQATVEVAGGASALASTAAPTVAGTAAVGSTLSCAGATWSRKPDAVAYAWLRDGSPIAGAKTATYVVVAGDAGHELACRATATAGGSSASATSAPVQVPAALANTEAPHVVGTVRLGSRVTCDPGTWTAAATFGYTWYWERPAPFPVLRLGLHTRLFGATKGAYYRTPFRRTVLETARIATGAALVVPNLPSDGRLTCTVTASSAAPTARKAVAAVAAPSPVRATAPALARGHDLRFHPPSITAGIAVGSTNTCNPGVWSGYPTFAYDWYSLGPKPTKRFVPRPRKLIWKGQSIKLGAFHEGMTIECTVTATNPAGTARLSSNAYVVPPPALAATNGVFVSVSTEAPSGRGGLVGPEGATVVAEKIHLQCLPPSWNRTPASVDVLWVPASGNAYRLLVSEGVPGDKLDFDMTPGKGSWEGTLACVVRAYTGNGADAVQVESGLVTVWNGCTATTETGPGQPPDAAISYTATAAGVVASIASGGIAGAVETGIFGTGFSPDLGSPFTSVFGSDSTTVYTTGPNCLDYQKYYEKQGYTVKQRDG